MQRRLLVKPDRQIAVAVRLARVGEEVARAVHRLHAHRLAFRFDEEHVLPVVLPVPRALPQRLVVDERRLHLDVAGGEEHVPHVVRERVVERRPLAQPERRAGRPRMEGEQAELPTELAMVAFLGFLDLREVRLQILLGQERGAIDALHRLVARVALPVRVGGAQQLERLQPAGRGDVRPDAEVDEGLGILDRVAGHLGLAFGLLIDQLDLERLAALFEKRLRPIARPQLPLVGQILGGQLLHLLLNGVEVLRHERPFDDEIVKEAVVGRRADPALCAREQVRHRRRQQVRRAVTIERQRLRAPVGDDTNRRVVLDRERQIDELPVDDAGERGLGETGRDLCRHVADERAGWHRATGAIGKRDGYLTHGEISVGGSSSFSGGFQQCLQLIAPALMAALGRHGWTRTTDLLRVKQAL